VSNNANTSRTTEDALLIMLVDVLSQQNRDLEAGLGMFKKKQGPPEERERLVAKAKAARAMFQKMRSSVASASTPNTAAPASPAASKKQITKIVPKRAMTAQR
jgi:hypothetical protein